MNPDTPVTVTPGHLAGPEDAAPALEVLYKKRNWPIHEDLDAGNTFVHSPCGRADAAFIGDYLSPWQVRVSREPMEEPAWFAAFDGNTPPEIIAAFFEILADTLENLPDQLTQSRAIYITEAVHLLEQAGWDKEVTATHTRMTPKGEHAGLAGLSIQQRPAAWEDEEFGPYAEPITMWGRPKGSDDRWEAKFTRDVPMHLVAAATRLLITTAPVERYEEGLDPAVLPYITGPNTAPSTRAAVARAASPAAAAAGPGSAGAVSVPAAVQRDAAAAAKRH
ncbi:DUF317 domain-containing protein [Streptomyces sp. 4F14]|uniref:DUF317 domain-containing protein n=1 Tax=Streptomyces sp. 4F14 TaxID=3394380 RepID=UPI003A881F5A